MASLSLPGTLMLKLFFKINVPGFSVTDAGTGIIFLTVLVCCAFTKHT
jgi:hypothetical protein